MCIGMISFLEMEIRITTKSSRKEEDCKNEGFFANDRIRSRG